LDTLALLKGNFMKAIHFISLVLLSAGLSAALCHAAPEAVPAPAVSGPTRVAVVQTLEVYRQIKETKAMFDTLDKMRGDLQAQDGQKQNELTGLIKDLHDTNPNHPSYAAKQATIEQKRDEYQAWAATSKAKLDRESKKMEVKVYSKIEAAVAKIAKQKNYDLVVTDNREEIREVDGVTSQALTQVLFTRPVVFYSKDIDITQLVITQLDLDFAQNGATTPPAPFQAPPATGAK
jgi:Skp family chaperone for outer membrane proteins